jgi:hypothetical protein
MKEEATIVIISSTKDGLTVQTPANLSDADCVSLLCALALNFEHRLEQELVAREILEAAAGSVDKLRDLASAQVVARGTA